jgi:hypothetical protein
VVILKTNDRAEVGPTSFALRVCNGLRLKHKFLQPFTMPLRDARDLVIRSVQVASTIGVLNCDTTGLRPDKPTFISLWLESKTLNESEMALFSKCLQRYAKRD